MEKLSQRKITVSDMAPHVHSFFAGENKTEKLAKWLSDWVKISLECGKISPGDFLPSKADLACHIGVSQGTMQNVFRIVEDLGYIESKQRIGTYIARRGENTSKLTSIREHAVAVIKKFIYENDYKKGDILISSRKLAVLTGISNTTLRMAIGVLVMNGILDKTPQGFVVSNLKFNYENIETQTLVEKIALSIKNYIEENLKSGDKLPSNETFQKMFGVSMKTVHDSMRLLSKQGILYTRRGRYGTIVAGNSAEIYDYEKFEQKIRSYIASNCKIGEKLPSIREFAREFQTSAKTIKKALDNLASEGFVTFVRGCYGGTFVTDIPQVSAEAYTWLALTSEYISGIKEGETLEN